jgi:GntR family carbon starvation induced transcriptional regulator
VDLQGVSDETLARVAADRMVSDIVSGALKPGRKLRVIELKNHYGIGASPLREALLLVTSLGYATGESHRGYRVAEVSPEDLADITRAREILEEGMLGASMANPNDEWEIGISAALERLRRAVTRAGADGFQSSDAVAASHKQLHAALVSNCGSTRLMDTQALLFDQARRYRDLMLEHVTSPADFIRVHEGLVAIVLGGQVDRAKLALREHLNLTPRDVYPA